LNDNDLNYHYLYYVDSLYSYSSAAGNDTMHEGIPLSPSCPKTSKDTTPRTWQAAGQVPPHGPYQLGPDPCDVGVPIEAVVASPSQHDFVPIILWRYTCR